MIVPAEIGHPVRICSLANIWETLLGVAGFDVSQLFELHAHHLTLSADGAAISCVVMHQSEGSIAGMTISLEEWLALPTPSEILEIPETPAALFDPNWNPRIYEPALNVKKVVPELSKQSLELLDLINRWETGRPVTRTIHFLEDITNRSHHRELISEASHTIEVILRASIRRSIRRVDRTHILDALQRIAFLIRSGDGGVDE